MRAGKDAQPTTDELPDRVIVGQGAEPRTLSVAEFTALPLTERVRYLLADQVRFFRGDRRVPTSEALRALMDSDAPGATQGG